MSMTKLTAFEVTMPERPRASVLQATPGWVRVAPASVVTSARHGYGSAHAVTTQNCIALTKPVAGFAGDLADVNGSAPALVARTESPPS